MHDSLLRSSSWTLFTILSSGAEMIGKYLFTSSLFLLDSMAYVYYRTNS